MAVHVHVSVRHSQCAAQVEVLPGSNFINGQNNLSNAVNEDFNKMTNDPLMMMRAEEQKALQRILSNPLKMKSIRSEVFKRQADKKVKKGKKEKKEKKHKKKDKGQREQASASRALPPPTQHGWSRSRPLSLAGRSQEGAQCERQRVER